MFKHLYLQVSPQKSHELNLGERSSHAMSPPVEIDCPGNICLNIFIDINVVWAMAPTWWNQKFSRTSTYLSPVWIDAFPTAKSLKRFIKNLTENIHQWSFNIKSKFNMKNNELVI